MGGKEKDKDEGDKEIDTSIVAEMLHLQADTDAEFCRVTKGMTHVGCQRWGICTVIRCGLVQDEKEFDTCRMSKMGAFAQ